jgi:hypothetical protein
VEDCDRFPKTGWPAADASTLAHRQSVAACVASLQRLRWVKP